MNIRDIARIANVTPGTVSKVLNNYPDISEATRKKVIDVINEYQYKPAFSTKTAQNFGKKPQIALITEGVYNSLYTEMAECFSIRLHNGDYTTLSYHDNYYVQDKEEKFEELLSYADEHSLSGIVYIGGNFANIKKSLFDRLPCPTVFVNTVLPVSFETTNYSSVLCNHFETGYHQMERLILAGHKHIAMMISSLADNSVYGLRLNGYKSVLIEHDLSDQINHIVEGDYIFEKTYRNMKAFLEKHNEITAICCSADIMAPAVIRAIYDIGKKPGQDIDIISFDGLDLMNYTYPSVTTFEQPKREMVDAIYNLLLGLIDGSKTHQHIVFQSKLVIRETCKLNRKK